MLNPIGTTDLPGILTCEEGHLHCLDCGRRWQGRGPVMLTPATSTKTGEHALSYICTGCSILLIAEVYSESEDEDEPAQPPLVN